ncbi:peptide/nickel transport system permease protein [Halobacillus dabanensis]|uniref:Peptide/nickel transport system permease protein n=1 Tax=Halobacillus dabanensis TaxID=240302 RepID=A0A1I3PXW9_HALDA|nr:ABC transporter permease subunit [Halobacillus dabanensis]SFJ25786.1 peptide/nickel transport system permease protein [Halobacillus dabanensis]
MKVVNGFTKYLVSVLGIILLSCVPVLFKHGYRFDFLYYLQTVWGVLRNIGSPSEWVFQHRVGTQYVEKPLFSYIFDNYLYSMTILFSALLIAIIFGMALALFCMGIPQKWKRGIHTSLNSLEAMPDILFLFLLQMLVVWYFNTFDVLLFPFVYLGEEKLYLSPILSLCILPMVLFFRLFLLLLEEEWTKDYVQLARSKGFSKTYILLKHCFRNIKTSFVIQSKPIVWFTLSSLLVIEYLHNIYGIVRLIFFDTRPFILAVALILIFTPFFLIYTFLEGLIKTEPVSQQVRPPKMLTAANAFSRRGGKQIFNMELIFDSIKRMVSAFKDVSRKPTFLLGCGYMIGITVLSISYTVSAEVPVEPYGIYQDEAGEYQTPPHRPDDGILWLGSNLNGYPIWTMLLTGAKYTVGVVLCISFVRILSGYLFAFPYVFWFGERTKKIINYLADGMQFLPLSLVTYLLLIDRIRFHGNERMTAENLMVPNFILEVVILVVFSIPVVLHTIGEESDELVKKEFIQASILLGASKSKVFFKHMTLHLIPRLIHLSAQQMIQVLQVLMHLGVLGIFLGGTIIGNREGASQSLLYEWTSMFETMRIGIMTERYWLILPVLVAYVLLIFSIQTIRNRLIEHQQRAIGLHEGKKGIKRMGKGGVGNEQRKLSIDENSFEFAHNKTGFE